MVWKRHRTPLEEGPLTEEDIRAHKEHDHIAAVFPGRDGAVAAVDELRELGLGSAELGVAVHGTDQVAFERDADTEIEHETGTGMGTGAGIGFLAGVTVFALTIPGIGTIGVGGVLALAAASGFGGSMLGGYFGLATRERAVNVHEELASIGLEPGQVLVAVCSHGHPGRIEEIFTSHGGHMLPTPR